MILTDNEIQKSEIKKRVKVIEHNVKDKEKKI